MRVKRIDVGARVGVLVVFAVLCAMALTAGSAFALNPERHYEQVSPVYKGGFGTGTGYNSIQAVAQNGESVAFEAPAAFAEAPAGLSQNIDAFDYVSRRSQSGWSTVAVMPPDTVLPTVAGGAEGPGNRDVSPNMEVTLALGQLGPSNEAAENAGPEAEFYLHDTELSDTSSNWTQVGPVLTRVDHQAPIFVKYLGASADFCHLFLDEENTRNEPVVGPTALLEQADNAYPQLYEVARGCSGEPVALRLVGVNNKGNLISPGCRVDLGLSHFAGVHKEIANSFNAVAADGELAFFTTCIDDVESDHQLFVRLGASRTIEVSRPLGSACSEVPCEGATTRASANFVGASEDGSKVFFTTTAPLEPATDKDNGNDLYMANIGCPGNEQACAVSEKAVTSLVQVSHSPHAGEAAEVQGVVRVAPDGQRVYFVARGVLSDEDTNAANYAPIQGADNLYVYDSASGKTEFIADLCSEHDTSGLVEDRHCPGGQEMEFREPELWLPYNDEAVTAQTAGANGEYLVFASYGQLTSDDTDAARDVYRFDAVTDTLERISLGEGGYDDNGNNSEFNAQINPADYGEDVLRQHEMNNRSVSEDGSRIVFTTAEPLSPAATNGLQNAYEWHENLGGGGSVSLLSGGSGGTPVGDVVISPEGKDVFFVTTEGLVPQDVDGESDVYDARLGSGFAPVPASTEPCSGDACQGPLTNPAPLLVPGSAVQAPGGNFPPAESLKTATPKKKKTKCETGKRLMGQRCVAQKKARPRKKSGKTSRRAGR